MHTFESWKHKQIHKNAEKNCKQNKIKIFRLELIHIVIYNYNTNICVLCGETAKSRDFSDNYLDETKAHDCRKFNNIQLY